MAKETIGVLLLNLGGPPDQAAVEPFLRNLFGDREIIQLPGGPLIQPAFARLIAKVRGPSVRKNYASIGGGSPILRLTQAQAAGLEAALNGGGVLNRGEVLNGSGVLNGGEALSGSGALSRAPRGDSGSAADGEREATVVGAATDDGSPRFRVGIAMRYWHPFTEAALAEMRRAGIRRIVALTLYPQFSAATTQSSLNELRRVASAHPELRITTIDRYPTDPGYIQAVAATVVEGLEGFPAADREKVVLLFSAHGLPMKFIEAGDPYVGEIEATRDAILADLRARGYANRWVLGYQSRTGPVKWIGPTTDEVIEELAAEGVRSVLTIPIAFVSDHIETLYEIDQLYADLAAKEGITDFRRTRMLNDDPQFATALADLVRRHLAEVGEKEAVRSS